MPLQFVVMSGTIQTTKEMKKLIIIFTIALISCKEEVSHDCLSNQYECVPSMTVGTTATISCLACSSITLECTACRSQTIIPNN